MHDDGGSHGQEEGELAEHGCFIYVEGFGKKGEPCGKFCA
jgi:hypothetical protein